MEMDAPNTGHHKHCFCRWCSSDRQEKVYEAPRRILYQEDVDPDPGNELAEYADLYAYIHEG